MATKTKKNDHDTHANEATSSDAPIVETSSADAIVSVPSDLLAKLRDMTPEQLRAIQDEATDLQHAKEFAKFDNVKAQITKILTDNGFTFEEVYGKVRAPNKKTMNRVDSGKPMASKRGGPFKATIGGVEKEWSGLGMRPNWMTDLISEGHSLAEFAADPEKADAWEKSQKKAA